MGRDPLLTNSYVFLWESCRQILPTLLLLFPFSLSRKSCLVVMSLLCCNALKHFNISVHMGNIIPYFQNLCKSITNHKIYFSDSVWCCSCLELMKQFRKIHLIRYIFVCCGSSNASWLSQISCWCESFVKNTLHKEFNVSIISQQSLANPVFLHQAYDWM